MKKILFFLVLTAAGTAAATDATAQTTLPNLSASSGAQDSDIFYDRQSVAPYDFKITGAQLKAYVLTGAPGYASSGSWTAAQAFTAASGTFTGLFDGVAFAGSGTLNIGSGGTLGSAAFQNTSAFQAPLALTTTGSGAATLTGATLNIPTPSAGGVTSLNTRTGAVTLTATDINATGTVNVVNQGSSATSGTATYAVTSGTSTYAATSGTATYASTSGSASSATTSGTATYATTSGTSSFASASPVSGLTGAGTGIVAALAVNANAANGIAVKGMNGDVLMNVPLTKVNSGTTTVLQEGDSTTAGAGVSDVRQVPAAILSTLGSCLNGSTVYRWGWSAYTTYSINVVSSQSQVANFWTGSVLLAGTGTINPSTLGAPYVIIDAGTNDYYGHFWTCTLSTGSNTITGMSSQTYLLDAAGHSRVVAVGDQVSGPSITGTATITAIPSGSSVTLDRTPTANGSQLLTFTPTPASSTYHTDLANLITLAHTANSSAKVFVATLRPANNITVTPANNTGNQGDFQASRSVYNTYIKSLTIGGGGANPDGIIDEAAMPEFASFNAAYFNADNLHPNFAGNQAIARAENNALIGVVPASNLVMLAGQESTPDTSLSNNVVLLNTGGTFSAAVNIGSAGVGGQISSTPIIATGNHVTCLRLAEDNGGNGFPQLVLSGNPTSGLAVDYGYFEASSGGIDFGGLNNSTNGVNFQITSAGDATFGGTVNSFTARNVIVASSGSGTALYTMSGNSSFVGGGTGDAWQLNLNDSNGSYGSWRLHEATGIISLTDQKNSVTELTVSPGATGGIGTPALKVTASATPATSSATGTTGQIEWDGSFIYICTATNTWKRAAISTW